MAKPDVRLGPANKKPTIDVIPIFVCPGVHDEPLPYALISLGDGFSRPKPCPIRDCCMWYCRHDLGGETSVCDFPPDAILAARFRLRPFYCADYKPDDRGRNVGR